MLPDIPHAPSAVQPLRLQLVLAVDAFLTCAANVSLVLVRFRDVVLPANGGSTGPLLYRVTIYHGYCGTPVRLRAACTLRCLTQPSTSVLFCSATLPGRGL